MAATKGTVQRLKAQGLGSISNTALRHSTGGGLGGGEAGGGGWGGPGWGGGGGLGKWFGSLVSFLGAV